MIKRFVGKKRLWRLEESEALLASLPSYQPFVSIHVACCNEPPELVIWTVYTILSMEYPNDKFEVLLISNNTEDENLWMPLADQSSKWRKVGRNIHFWHFPILTGAKAGALNFALEVMDKRAEVICIIDADYQAQCNWMRKYVKLLQCPNVGFVQMAQDYRDNDYTPFKRLVYPYYRHPSIIDFPLRNEENAAFPIGSMCLLKVSAVKEAGWWRTDSVTEDYSMGLMLRSRGYDGYFFPQMLGSGLMANNYAELAKQRFRWNVGPIQMLRKHFRWFVPGNQCHLTESDKKWERNLIYKYADNFFVGLLVDLSIIVGLLVAMSGVSIEAPLIVHSAIVAMWARRVYRTSKSFRVAGFQWKEIAGVFLVGNALMRARTKAVIHGLLGLPAKFERTSKFKEKTGGLRRAFAQAKQELAIGMTYGVLGGFLCSTGDLYSLTTLAGAMALHRGYKYLCSFVLAAIP